MKTLLVSLLLTLAAVTLHAQAQNPLAGTAWQGQAYVPDEATIILHFKADSVSMFIAPDMILGETMAYTVKADTLTLRKISGNSPCDTRGIGTLQFTLKNDDMTVKSLADDCRARKVAWGDKPFRKVAIPVK
ncbi:MAG TPA: hypothetical protein VGA96_03635 [Fibrella sp.]|jgi:hypothetical protein